MKTCFLAFKSFDLEEKIMNISGWKIFKSTLFIMLLNFFFDISFGKHGRNLQILDSTRYLKLEEQYDFLQKLTKIAKPVMKLKVIGDTFIEGKNVTNKIYLATFGKKTNPIIFFDCGAHAREWISSATCLFLIQKLAIHFKKKPHKSAILNYQWQIVPMLNPDGYSISHQGESYRMQRKNARPYQTMNLTDSHHRICRCELDPYDCLGVDLNRNFPAGWGKGSSDFQESSSLPCMEYYKGETPISEPETKALHNHMMKIKDKVKAAIAIHSYGQEIYYPKGWLDEDDEEQIKGEHLTALKKFAKFFNKELGFGIGSVFSLIGKYDLEGGSTDDYYYTTLNISLSYTVELDPDLDDYKINFKLSEKNITNVGEKMWQAIHYMANYFDKEKKKEENKPNGGY